MARQPAIGDAGTASALPASRIAGPADPPPYAPGGDDLLSSGPPLPLPLHTAALALAAPGRTPPAPLLWLDRTTVRLGEAVVLHLAAADGSTCQGAGALAGWVGTGPRIELRASAPGQHWLAVDCSGPGGPAHASVLLTVPLPVAPGAADGAQSQPAAGAQQGARLPDLRQLGLQPLGPAGDHSPDLLAEADFFQQGQASLWVIAGSAADAGPGAVPQAHVLARDAAGRWVDRSAELLDEAERGVCASAVQVLVADFNRDGRPDVWLVCGSGRQGLFLSQADGRYRRIDTPLALQARQAEARDVDGDGWPDIVTLAVSNGLPHTLLLLGQGDGRFVAGPAEAWGLGGAGAVAQRR